MHRKMITRFVLRGNGKETLVQRLSHRSRALLLDVLKKGIKESTNLWVRQSAEFAKHV